MDESVYLHDKAGGRAIEIDDKPANDLLAAEVSVVKAMMPQLVPQYKLSLGHLLSKSSSSLS